MNVYEKIEKIFQTEDPQRPEWVDEILFEIRELKAELKSQKEHNVKGHHHGGLYAFVKDFRKSMRADVVNNIYPEVEHDGKKYGVNFKGLLYDKMTSNIVPVDEAKKIYRVLYESKYKCV